MTDNAVTRWFGAKFSELHPLLQSLHRQGGRLQGEVTLGFGRGPAGWFGRRLAARLGLPQQPNRMPFEVQIGHASQRLSWDRWFDGRVRMHSLFQPVGCWPTGYWVESTGLLRLCLTVDVIDGGWYWRCLGVRVMGLRLPAWLFPRSRAYKRIEDGRYRFHVGFALPLLGTLLWYEGLLEAQLPELPSA